jgi:IS30 family transposase
VLLRSGLSIVRCARGIGFSRQTVSTEVQANGGRKRYNPFKANKKAKARRFGANQCHRKWSSDSWYAKVTVRLLRTGWSPEQVIGRIGLELKLKPFCFTTVYNNLNKDKELCKILPRGHSKYRRRKDGNERIRQRKELDQRRSIDSRPAHIESRKNLGHWEGDTIIGKERTTRILTHVERKSGYLLAGLLRTVSAETVRKESVKAFGGIPDTKRQTITYDRGSEFADYELLERQTEARVYFAHAYHSWERGTSENTNGLLRRYFPKKTYFSTIETEQLNQVVEEINTRPRKRLGYRTPHEVFNSVKLRVLM